MLWLVETKNYKSIIIHHGCSIHDFLVCWYKFITGLYCHHPSANGWHGMAWWIGVRFKHARARVVLHDKYLVIEVEGVMCSGPRKAVT